MVAKRRKATVDDFVAAEIRPDWILPATEHDADIVGTPEHTSGLVGHIVGF